MAQRCDPTGDNEDACVMDVNLLQQRKSLSDSSNVASNSDVEEQGENSKDMDLGFSTRIDNCHNWCTSEKSLKS